MTSQLPLFPDLTYKFPSTRYQGSKAKLVNWIWDQIKDIPFQTCMDAFGGTGSVAYRLKQEGKAVTYNDLLKFNYHFGQALIENADATLTFQDIDWVLSCHADIHYQTFVEDTFRDIYFTNEENRWIDQTIANIEHLSDFYGHSENTSEISVGERHASPLQQGFQDSSTFSKIRYKQSLAFFALAQSCIIKRPYNLFHRKNLYIRFADVERSFGNKASWDKPFDEWFKHFVQEANDAVFDNEKSNSACNQDALSLPQDYDLVYIDPPYISSKGVATDYRDFYHFLEGLTMVRDWPQQVDYQSKHRRLKREENPWVDKQTIHQAFDDLFAHFRDSILVVSYRSDGIPTQSELIDIMKQYKSDIRVAEYGQYQYALSTNKKSQEILLIGLS